MSNPVTKLAIAALLAAVAAPALAAPGDGIRVGGSEGRLHPFVDVEGRYDSNVYSGWDAAGTALSNVSDFIIHVRPGLTLDVPGEMTSVSLSANLDWATYLGTKTADGFDTSKLSNVYASADLGLSVNSKGAVGLEVDDAFRRSDRPQALAFGAAAITNYNTLDVKVPFRPGGGALTLSLGGNWVIESYEEPLNATCGPAGATDPLCDVAKLGYNQFGGGAGAVWKFLPRTAALLDVTYAKFQPNDSAGAAARSGDPSVLRVPAGLTGLVTPHLAATLKVGYGGTSGDTGIYDSLGTWLATVEGEWLPNEGSSVKLGWTHDLGVDSVALYDLHKVYLYAHTQVATRVQLGLRASWQRLGYSVSTSQSTDIAQVQPSVGVDITRWLKTEVAYAYTNRTSTTGAPSVGGDYDKSEAWLKATFTY